MKVSVLMLAYNHVRFIRQAVASVLDQETDFEIELVTGDDASTDGTTAVLGELATADSRMRLLPPGPNLGMVRNLQRTLGECRGDYVAILEGDDFWTDPTKLQRQVAYMETHPHCAVTFHSVSHLLPDGSRVPRVLPPTVELSYGGLLVTNYIATCAVMYRQPQRELPSWILPLSFSDWPLHLLHARHGDVGYIDRPMATYRVHDAGAWSGTDRAYGAWVGDTLRMYDGLANHAPDAERRLIEHARAEFGRRIVARILDECRGRESADAALDHARLQLGSLVGVKGGDAIRQAALAELQELIVFRPPWPTSRHDRRAALAGLISGDRTWLRNRGVWSLGLDAWLGIGPSRRTRATR